MHHCARQPHETKTFNRSAAVGTLLEEVTHPERPDIDVTAEFEGQAGRNLRCEIVVTGNLEVYVTVVDIHVVQVAAHFELRCDQAAHTSEQTNARVINAANRRVDFGANEASVSLDIPVLLKRENIAGANLERASVGSSVQVIRRITRDAEPGASELERTTQFESVTPVIDIDVPEFTERVAERRLIGALRNRSTVQEQQRNNSQDSHVFLPSIDGSEP